MSVIDRLQRPIGEKAPSKPAAPREGERAEEIRALRARIEAVLTRRPEGRIAETDGVRGGAVPPETLVPGAELVNAAGRCFCVEQVAPGSAHHDSGCIRDPVPGDMDRLALIANDPALRTREYREALFLDTETTGLAAGLGPYSRPSSPCGGSRGITSATRSPRCMVVLGDAKTWLRSMNRIPSSACCISVSPCEPGSPPCGRVFLHWPASFGWAE
jgi:hypothetical protein